MPEPQMDELSLNGLRYEAPHGWHEQERDPANPTLFEVDLVLTGEFRTAGENLSRVPDYETLEAEVRQVMNGQSRKLIETLCREIGERLLPHLERLPVGMLTVRVRKMPPPLQTPCDSAQIQMKWPVMSSR